MICRPERLVCYLSLVPRVKTVDGTGDRRYKNAYKPHDHRIIERPMRDLENLVLST